MNPARAFRLLLAVSTFGFACAGRAWADPPAVAREENLAKKGADGIKPHPLPAIPDDPPPHEGAMIDEPYVVEPPDLIRIEILELLPGRPITGERLVRSDGTVSLDFYGVLHVRGLTAKQIKIKTILHLRKFVSDDFLGLWETERWKEPSRKPERLLRKVEEPPLPLDQDPAKDLRLDDAPLEVPSRRPSPQPGRAQPKTSSRFSAPFFRLASDESPTNRTPPPRAPVVESRFPEPEKGQSKNVGDDDEKAVSEAFRLFPRDASPGKLEGEKDIPAVSPANSASVFVDVASYNTKNYSLLDK